MHVETNGNTLDIYIFIYLFIYLFMLLYIYIYILVCLGINANISLVPQNLSMYIVSRGVCMYMCFK